MTASFLPRVWPLAAGLALAAPAPTLAESALARGTATSATARLLLQVRIPALARVLPSGQPRQLAVTPHDIERGFVDVPDARIEVLANTRGEKRLIASVIAAFARSVEITGLPQAVVAGPQGDVRLWDGRGGVVDRRYDVRYRIHLDGNTVPGLYPWPVSLQLEVH